MKKLNIYFQLGLFLLSWLLSGCMTTRHPYFASYQDISQHSKVEHLIGRYLELKQDVFLFQFPDTKTYALDIPGYASYLPSSILEYEKDPLNWQNTDSNAHRGRGATQGYMKNKVIAIIPKGTKLYVFKILEKQTFYESFIKVMAYLDDQTYGGLPIDIYFLLSHERGKVIIPYPCEPELSAMGREIIPCPKPGVIEYCD